MTPPKIFITGATGYIGGDALYALYQAHRDYDYTCLVRNSDKGALIASKYATVKLVYGTLDDAALLETEARKADIVCHFADADHETAAKALIKGLASHLPSSQPSHLLHTSGTGLLLHQDLQSQTLGEESSKIYDDWDGLEEVTVQTPDMAPHRTVDKIVLAAATDYPDRHVRTAIVCPPTIYGRGRGPGNKRSAQLYELTRATLERGEGFIVGKGQAHWTYVNVADLSDLYVRLVEAAVKDQAASRGQLGQLDSGPAVVAATTTTTTTTDTDAEADITATTIAVKAAPKTATWNAEGYYFAEAGDFVWGDMSRAVARAAHKQGLIGSSAVVSLPPDEVNRLQPFGAYMWGANSRCKAVRARKLLGWRPKERGIFEEVDDAVASEARRLKIVPGHAKVAAGKA